MSGKTRAPAMRSQLGRVRGLGSAKAGVEHWWVERLTGIALAPLSVWFVVSVIVLLGSPQPVVAHWAGRPLNSALLLALIVLTFHHLQLGLQVVYEDYIHEPWMKLTAILLTKGAAIVLGLMATVAVLRMATWVPG